MLSHTKMEANSRTYRKNQVTDDIGVMGSGRIRKKGVSLSSQTPCL